MTFAVRLLPLCVGLPLIFAAAQARYAPSALVESWTFTEPTPAYSPETGEALGDFQTDVKVEVIEMDWNGGTWLVEYPRYGAAPIRALIAIPDLSKVKPRAYQYVREDIAAFPLLRKQLEADHPWSVPLAELKSRLLGEREAILRDGTSEHPRALASADPTRDGFAWDQMPLELRLEQPRAGQPRIVINYWNKGDRDSVVDPRRAYPELKDHLEKIQNAFGTRPSLAADSSSGSGITALRDGAETFYLPNNIRADLRYDPREYLTLELSPLVAISNAEEEDTLIFTDNIRTTQEGERYISGIPMVNQGDKGYCVAATLTRVLNYYGYHTNMHAVASLAETERYGTSLPDMVSAMRRISSATPYRLKEIEREDIVVIHSIIDKGLPIIWLIPGHCRLIIGIHPEEGTVVYSDSWGPDHAFKTMPYSDYLSLNRYMFVLDPKE
ncbi:C39 family peptidase [Ruficoccus sp. ZRK36]|uniref:C39 family peptidase n=1 Tax=Ruficoccus sp. ZRK36 TaxID=2866311 RepID=UPI001C72B184|nr:C39 family peptidase [Ruficoccus sp. ZRK36]QYY37097.1 C39 family peptidase [Ruficoccus sp. ZRK36]